MLRPLKRLLDAARLPALSCSVLVVACGASEPGAPEPGPIATTRAGECEHPAIALADGSCIRPGIPPDGCSPGFEHDGEYGCDPILPEDGCAPGMMAVPGDVACRPVMPCGSGKWGDLPVAATTQYVDGSYAGGSSDGSGGKPWTSVADAYQAAAPGALIAVAEGRYVGGLRMGLKPVRLWGVCPEKVSIVRLDLGPAILLSGGSDGAEVGGLAITSGGLGVGIVNARNVTLDRLWIHDTIEPAIAIQDPTGFSSAHVTRSLIEGSWMMGIYTGGGDLSLLSTVVRDTLPRHPDQLHGVGVDVRPFCGQAGCDATTRPRISIEHCLLEGNRTQGLAVMGADLNMLATVVRDTWPQLADNAAGEGIRLVATCNDLGRCEADQPTRAIIAGSAIANNHTAGLFVEGSQVELVTSVVRGTRPHAADESKGYGVMAHAICADAACTERIAPQTTIRNALVEGHYSSAILTVGSPMTVAQTVARRTKPRQSDAEHGYGVMAQFACEASDRCNLPLGSELTLSESLVADTHVAGIKIIGSNARLAATLVQETAPGKSGEFFGDGVLFASHQLPASGVIDALTIRNSSRAGIANFGSNVSIQGSRIACAAFGLVGEPFKGAPFRFEDGGGNVCGCPEPNASCKAVSAGLEPPQFD